jgi:hypothetical protein
MTATMLAAPGPDEPMHPLADIVEAMTPYIDPDDYPHIADDEILVEE